jgi:hypothetical protein
MDAEIPRSSMQLETSLDEAMQIQVAWIASRCGEREKEKYSSKTKER